MVCMPIISVRRSVVSSGEVCKIVVVKRYGLAKMPSSGCWDALAVRLHFKASQPSTSPPNPSVYPIHVDMPAPVLTPESGLHQVC